MINNKVKTGACTDKNGLGKPAKLLKMDLVSIKMQRKETWIKQKNTDKAIKQTKYS